MMDLPSLQQQLKVAIQSHQILVSKMKADPQNSTLQKQLHELQAEIMALSEKQKQVVQQLRKEFEIKQHQALNSTCGHIQHNLDGHPVTIQTTPAFIKTDHLPIKPIPVSASSALIIPTTLTLKIQSEQSKPVYVTTSPLHIPKSTETTPCALNLTPTIRVPQYPPPQVRPQVSQNQTRPSSTSPSSVISSSVVRQLPIVQQSVKREQSIVSPKSKAVINQDLQKVDFMAALGLVTQDTLSELQSKRSERKRRTAANSQFSYGNWDHSEFLFFYSQKKRKSNNYLASSGQQNLKRPRGRPRLGSSPNNSRPVTPEDGSDRGSPNGYANSAVRNGVTPEQEELCSICQHVGDLLNCDTCMLSYHRECLEQSQQDLNPGTWMCPKCQLMKKMPMQWPGSLAMVHSYIAHKAAKEEEKRKLIKRSSELKAEHDQLEQKVQQLSGSLSVQVQQRTDMLVNTKQTQENIDKLKNLIKFFQVS